MFELDLSTIITISCFILSEISPFITNHQINGITHGVITLLQNFLKYKADNESNEQALEHAVVETVGTELK